MKTTILAGTMTTLATAGILAEMTAMPLVFAVLAVVAVVTTTFSAVVLMRSMIVPRRRPVRLSY